MLRNIKIKHQINLNEIFNETINIPLRKLYVINSENFKNINKLKNLNIEYSIYEAKNGNVSRYLTDKQYKNIKNVDNMSKKLSNLKNFECHVATKEFDFVKGTIKDCCKSYSLSPFIKMNDENIKNAFIDPAKHFLLCNHCPKKLKSFKNILKCLK